MQKLKNIDEALACLRDGDLLTGEKRELYYWKDNKVQVYLEGTHFALDPDDFIQLYKKNTFYLYEESVEIDESKDDDYYRYYRK